MPTRKHLVFDVKIKFFLIHLLPEKPRHVAFFQNSLFNLKQTQMLRLVTQRLLESLLVSNSGWSLPVAYSPAHDTPLIMTSVSLVRIISLAWGESL